MPQKDPLLPQAIRQQANKHKHRRYGYRRISEILCTLGWLVNHKRVYRIWRQEHLRLPQKRQQRKRYNGNWRNPCDQLLNTKGSEDSMKLVLANAHSVWHYSLEQLRITPAETGERDIGDSSCVLTHAIA